MSTVIELEPGEVPAMATCDVRRSRSGMTWALLVVFSPLDELGRNIDRCVIEVDIGVEGAGRGEKRVTFTSGAEKE